MSSCLTGVVGAAARTMPAGDEVTAAGLLVITLLFIFCRAAATLGGSWICAGLSGA